MAIFDTCIDKVLRVTEINAILDSHVPCVRIADSRECACCDIVPNLQQSQKIESLARVVQWLTCSIRPQSKPREDQEWYRVAGNGDGEGDWDEGSYEEYVTHPRLRTATSWHE